MAGALAAHVSCMRYCIPIFLVTHCCALHTTHKRSEVQDPHQPGKARGTEFGMHLGLVETGYEDKKVRVKTKEADPAKQVRLITLYSYGHKSCHPEIQLRSCNGAAHNSNAGASSN